MIAKFHTSITLDEIVNNRKKKIVNQDADSNTNISWVKVPKLLMKYYVEEELRKKGGTKKLGIFDHEVTDSVSVYLRTLLH